MAQPQPDTLDLVDDGTDDLSLRWGRYYEHKHQILKSAPSTALDMAGGDVTITSLAMEVRRADAAQTLVATGSPVFSPDEAGDGSDGWVTLIVPETAWAAGTNRTQSCTWDLVGYDGSGQPIQLLEGAADVVRTTTSV